MSEDITDDQNNTGGIDDIDTPVDEKLLMDGEEVADTGADDAAAAEATAIAEAAAAEAAAAEKPDGDDKAAAAGKDKDGFIPKERFNQVWAEKRALEERIRELEGDKGGKPDAGADSEAQTVEVDIKALRKAATEALLDGDTDKHNEIQGQIDDEIQRRAEIRAEQRIDYKAEVKEFKAVAKQLTEENPMLNPETGNQKAIDFVVRQRDAYRAAGNTLAESLKMAVADMKELTGAAQATSPAADGDGKQPDDPRKVVAIKRGADANNRIPPQGAGVGNRAMDVPDTTDIPQDKWDKLSDSEREKILAEG